MNARTVNPDHRVEPQTTNPPKGHDNAMGDDLIATVLPKLTAREYQEVIDRADAQTLATAAFTADYQGEFGDDAEFTASTAELITESDPSAVDLIAAHPGAVDAVRAVAENGARYVLDQMHEMEKLDSAGTSFAFDAAALGGPDVLVVGGPSFDDDPFEEFRGVAILAALLTAEQRARR